MLAVREVRDDKYPGCVPRLYEPYFFDRLCEHPDIDKKTIFSPILCNEVEGLRVRVSRNLIYQGYSLAGRKIDEAGDAALDGFFSIIDDPKMYIEFRFKLGQIQFLNNRVIGHKRTSFKDLGETGLKRKLSGV
tara:strand:+ start:113 stop:511 length:399 start_codon:yes stop_codon:yes gene_type:complete